MEHTPTFPIELVPLSTDREECLTFTTGPVDPACLDRAEHYRFDHVPVLDPTGRICGLISTKAAREALETGTNLEATSAQLKMHEVPGTVNLFDLLNTLSDHRAVVVRDAERDADWFALLSVSDLNRHSFRTKLYQPMVDLEVALAELLDRYFDNPWDWIVLTSERAQVQIVGQWELEKRASVDTHPVTACMLVDLVTVLGKSAELREMVGYRSKSKFDDLTGKFADFRNRVMHPVRPLILQHEDVEKLHKNIEGVMTLSTSVQRVNRDLQAKSTRGIRYLP